MIPPDFKQECEELAKTVDLAVLFEYVYAKGQWDAFKESALVVTKRCEKD